MVFIEICVGSSCHIKGSQDIVELMDNAVKENKLEDKVVLSGCFCAGKCNRVGVTVKINDEIFTGITRDNFREFFNDTVMKKIKADSDN